ncbi:hypothetical protein D3C81_661870 [compost metagenome]
MGQGEAVAAQGVRKTTRVKIQPQSLRLGPFHPMAKVRRFNGVTLHRHLAFQIDCMQVHPLWPRDKRHGPLQIGAQLVGIGCPARIIAGGLNTAGQRPLRIFKAAHVITLPAVH